MNFTTTATYKVYGCNDCDVSFGIEWNVAQRMERQHENVYCPRGHRMRFCDETELDRLRARSLRLESQIEFERNSRRNAETVAKRERTRRKNVEKRIAKGVCPCCRRHFVNVERHMASKHPGKVI